MTAPLRLQSERSSLLSGNTGSSVNMHRVGVQLPSAADTLWLCLLYRGLNSFHSPAARRSLLRLEQSRERRSCEVNEFLLFFSSSVPV